jgi:DNA-binding transcriptional MerR regulator
MTAKMISKEYLTELNLRIEQGERPKKTGEDAITSKDFLQRMLPHIKTFLAQGYTHKEIAKFMGHVSAEDVKKVLEKDADALKKIMLRKDAAASRKEEKTSKNKEADEPGEAAKAAAAPIPSKNCKGRKASQVSG